VPEIREIFRGFAFEGVDLNYTVGANSNGTAARELIIMPRSINPS
jgi:hypothetical protein